MPIRRSGVGLRHAYTGPASTVDNPVSALTFAANQAASSDVRIVWSGSNLLSRTAHTAIWKSNWTQQTGYYAWAWHAYNDGSFHGANYEYGTHPFPCDGAVDGNGQATGGTSGSGTVHYYEQAGFGAHDYLCSPSQANGAPTIVTKGAWVTQARTCSIQGSNLRHRYWPDVSAPTVYIEQTILLSSLESPGSPAFYFGCSDWRSGLGGGGAGTNDETPRGSHRFFMLFSAELSITDIASEAAYGVEGNAVTSNGQAAVWYINKNPTHTDVSDKSSAGHSPSWANANRPTTFTF